ncbi:MAG TPA: helix-turn-helix domain-containing protein [Candidatus Eisenbacteria bacterium]|nr:helix-turn-helix domain-containing protein [Candidatus Eisenbacteria bacterium]
MQPSGRLSSRERRDAIVGAVREVFARNGFDGTTTRALARAAGVSEALLYKHFPSKESLYAAMLDACAQGPAFAEFTRILGLTPSTATLVAMVHFTICHYVSRCSEDAGEQAMQTLLVRSLLEDGEFVRLTHNKFATAWIKKFAACLKQAAACGDLRDVPVRRDLRVWFVHHIAFSLMLYLHPKVPAIDYRASRDALIEQATWFALLGTGLKESAIRRHYNAKARSFAAR